MRDWDFRVRGFAGGHHHGGVPFGILLVETTHVGESSASLEIEAWKSRMRDKPGDVSRAELIDLRLGGTLTNMNVRPETKIPWSWTKWNKGRHPHGC